MNKVFEIGVMKTGTSSLGKAFEILGFKHKGWDAKLYEKFCQEKSPNVLINELEKHDAFEDGPWHDVDYKWLDMKYPGSKFIVLERNTLDWLRSMQRHHVREFNPTIPDAYLDDRWINPSDNFLLSEIQRKQNKYQEIENYFQYRKSDFLRLNICMGNDRWSKLCNFLNRPIPDEPFPFLNAHV